LPDRARAVAFEPRAFALLLLLFFAECALALRDFELRPAGAANASEDASVRVISMQMNLEMGIRATVID
jgi:hypothetical protein